MHWRHFRSSRNALLGSHRCDNDPTTAGHATRSPSRDNGVVYIARAFVQQRQFLNKIAQIAHGLPPQVISVTPTLGSDWAGEPAVYFQVVFADNAIPRQTLLAFTKDISHTIVQRVRPLEEWGVLPYFNFLTQSEAARMPQPDALPA